MRGCRFAKECEHYREDSATCKRDDHASYYCGAYRELEKEENEIII